MRPNNAGRRGGRRNGGGGHSNEGRHRNFSGSSSPSSQPQNRSASSLRNQIFDSNGPDMRVRGNAFQVHEKYQALAKDALSSGDRVLAENYLQHAEHYFRIIEAINEATAAELRTRQASWESQPQPQQQPYSEGGQPAPQQGEPEQGQPNDGLDTSGGNNQNPYMNAPSGQQRQDYRSEQRSDQRQERYEQRREPRRDQGRDNYRDQGNRDQGNRENGNRDQNRDNYRGQHRRDNYNQPSQYQQQGHVENPAPQQQSQDPLYDGVDEERIDTQDVAIGGRR